MTVCANRKGQTVSRELFSPHRTRVTGRRSRLYMTAALTLFLLTLTAFTVLPRPAGSEPAYASGVRVEISFDAGVRSEALTGRVYVAVSRERGRERRGQVMGPIWQAGETGVPLYGLNVEELQPGRSAVINGSVFGWPVESLDEIPPGDYWVQGFANVYTRFERADGHTVWMHMDQWEGQNWRNSPGNLYSEPQQITISGRGTTTIRLVCDQIVGPRPEPEETADVKIIKFESPILSAWWGHPIYIGATVRLPAGYDDHPDTYYPVNYVQGHFSTGAPRMPLEEQLAETWPEGDIPRFIYVNFQHPSPYYDDSYGVNSANNGPYGDAIMHELIPAVEERFRIIREPWARKLTGGSTGGWIALAYQVFYPDFFGGCWASCPDGVDFRGYQIVNIYADENAYFLDRDWMRIERPNRRSPDGNIRSMMKDENLYELVVGDHSRSGGQWDIWEATYSPCGSDGYPARIWDKRTGEIDREVAEYWRENYDLRYILERDWATLGPKLVGKIHVYCGDMDSYYLNNGVHFLHDFLESTTQPYYYGEVAFQPLAPHCWGPRGVEQLQLMTRHIEEWAPPEADLTSWRYR